MPSNRTPRGGKPPAGRPQRPAAGPRKGSAERGPAPSGSRERAGRPGRTEGGRTEGGRPERAGRPARDERTPRGGRAEGGRPERSDRPARDERAPRGGRPEFGRGERLARPSREERAPRREYTERPEAEQEGGFGGDIVFGRHPALAVLEGDQPVNKVWLLRTLANLALVAQVRQLAKEKGATVQMVDRPKLDALTFEGNHQGIVVSVAAAAYVDLDEAIEKARASDFPALLMLDGIEDPHNLGALIRTAEGAGFAAVIIPSRRAVGLTPTVHKASAGAVARMPVARVGNLAQAVDTLHKAGFWLLGADASGKSLPYEVDMTVPLVVVVGAEGKGLSRLLADKCDFLVNLPLGGELESLNASVAGGVLMYEAVRQRWVKALAAKELGSETAGG